MHLMFQTKLALANLISARLRTVLAMLGILVGTASVVAMVSSGQLATKQALAQFKQLGTDLLSVSIYDEGGGGPGKGTPFTIQDALAIVKVSPQILQVAPYTTSYAPIIYQGNKLNAGVVGVTQDLQSILAIHMMKGRFISFLDHNSFFAVIGQNVYQEMQGMSALEPHGRQVRVGSRFFTIVGIAEQWPENSFFNQDINSSILIPIEASFMLSKYTQINNLIIRLAKDAPIDEVESKIKAYIETHVPGKKLFFRSAKELVSSMIKQRQILTLFLGLIGSISLLVGGIGVMNVMLVSVVERRREIGIRRAIGARKWDIQVMFLLEAILLSISGGLIGIILGVLISFIIALVAHWEFEIFLLPPLIGFTVSVLVGIFFGFYPAYQASRLDPMVTLRSE